MENLLRNSRGLDERVTFRLDADRFRQLRSISSREGFDISTIVRHLVHRFLEEQRRLNVSAR